jgi:hypothetical protein
MRRYLGAQTMQPYNKSLQADRGSCRLHASQFGNAQKTETPKDMGSSMLDETFQEVIRG